MSQQSIGQIKALPLGSVVTTTGTITTGPEFGLIRYLQDGNAGIAAYGSSLSSTHAGDSIIITGVLSRYRGELQLSPVTSFQIVANGKTTIELLVSDFAEISTTSFESEKVAFNCVAITSCESELDAGWYSIYDHQGAQVRLAVADGHPIIGFPITNRPVAITGIWTKVEDQYQLLCQQIADASEGGCHLLPMAKASFEGLTTKLSWDNLPEALTWLDYGLSTFDLSIPLGVTSGTLDVALVSLIAGQIYQARLGQMGDANDTVYSPPVFITAAVDYDLPIEILFNRSVNSSFSDGSHPLATGSSVIETDIIQRIDQVQSTLDIAMYNTTRATIVQAISRAVSRGVVVRYIADDETSNSALDGILSFPVLFRTGDGIMHNKFLIADADDPQNAWLWTGSTNLSSNQLSSDPNHAYVIRDQAIALSYRWEFEEMWGALPNHSDSRTGDLKSDNTVHLLYIGDALIESYFSPSDETNCHILEALHSTNHHVEIGLLLLTKEDLVDEILQLYDQGIDIRIILEDEASSSTALARIRQAGIPVVTHDFSPIFHHKYALIDEGFPESDPQVITGSHNWTWSADNINDENTMIIHDQSVTNIFRQEFEARWAELNTTATNEVHPYELSVYPNPATTHVDITNPFNDLCEVELTDIFGRTIATTFIEAESNFTFNLRTNLPSGTYILHFHWPKIQMATRLMISE